MFILAQFFGILVLIANILSMQMKNKKQIIFLFMLINVFASINYLLLKGYSGAIICFFSLIETLISKAFEKNGKKVPKAVLGIFIIISTILGMITFNIFIDVIPIICSILYIISIIQEKETNIRKVTLLSLILWIIYDILCQAYTTAISDSLMAISTIIGMYRFDYKKQS
jgi:hypothetical protein